MSVCHTYSPVGENFTVHFVSQKKPQAAAHSLPFRESTIWVRKVLNHMLSKNLHFIICDGDIPIEDGFNEILRKHSWTKFYLSMIPFGDPHVLYVNQ